MGIIGGGGGGAAADVGVIDLRCEELLLNMFFCF